MPHEHELETDSAQDSGAPNTQGPAATLEAGPMVPAFDARAAASGSKSTGQPLLIPSTSKVSLKPGGTATLTFRVHGAKPTGKVEWSPMLGDPDSTTSAEEAEDLSLATTDDVVRANLAASTGATAKIELSSQGPVGRRILHIACEFHAGKQHIHAMTTQPVEIVVDSELAKWGRAKRSIEDRHDAGGNVDASERIHAQQKILSAANATLKEAGDSDDALASILPTLRDELQLIHDWQKDGVENATSILGDSLHDGHVARSMLLGILDGAFLFVGLLVPGGAAAGKVAEAATRVASSKIATGVKTTLVTGRSMTKGVAAWLEYKPPPFLGSAQQLLAASAGALTNVRGAVVVEQIRSQISAAFLAAKEAILQRHSIALAALMSAAPPERGMDMDKYRTALLLAMRNALYGQALDQQGNLAGPRITANAARDVHRLFLRQTAHLNAEGKLTANRGSKDHAAGVDAAKSQLGPRPTEGFEAMDLVIAQIQRAAAELAVQVPQFDKAQMQDLFGRERGLNPVNGIKVEVPISSAPMVFHDRIPGRWQRMRDQGLVRTEPEIRGTHYLGAENVPKFTSCFIDTKKDLRWTDEGERRLYSLRHVRFQAIGKETHSTAVGMISPPSSFTVIYNFE